MEVALRVRPPGTGEEDEPAVPVGHQLAEVDVDAEERAVSETGRAPAPCTAAFAREDDEPFPLRDRLALRSPAGAASGRSYAASNSYHAAFLFAT